MKLSVVIVNYRGWKKLRLCLKSLACLNNASFDWEVIIVDNQSDDGELPGFIHEFPQFRFIENEGNYGFSNGCNLGARQSKGEYIFFLNSDTQVTLESIQQLLTSLLNNPEISILSCQQKDETGRDTKPYGLFLKPTTLTSMLRSFYRLVHKPLPIHFLKSGIKIIYPEWVSGSAIMISKKLFDEIGGWSEDFWMYYEDADLCKRVTNLGGKVALLTNVQIIHNHGGSSRINFEVKALTKSEVIISKHVYINKYFTGIKHFVMQASLVFSNLLLDSLFMAFIGLLFFFKPSLRVYMRVYANTITYYKGVIANGTWLSPRSTNFRKE